MAALSDLYNDVLIEAPGAPHPLVIRELRNALSIFCDKSHFWRYNLPPILVDTGETGVDIPGAEGGIDIDFSSYMPLNSVLCKIMKLKFNDGVLNPISVSLLDYNFPGWRTTSSTTNPSFVEHPNGCMLAPTPSLGSYLHATVALKPDRTSTFIADSIVADFHQTIVDGALAALLAMPERPWTKLNLAEHYSAEFQKGIDRATVKARQDHQPKNRVTPYGGL